MYTIIYNCIFTIKGIICLIGSLYLRLLWRSNEVMHIQITQWVEKCLVTIGVLCFYPRAGSRPCAGQRYCSLNIVKLSAGSGLEYVLCPLKSFSRWLFPLSLQHIMPGIPIFVAVPVPSPVPPRGQSTCPISSCCVTSNRTLTSAETQLPLPTIQGFNMLCALEGLSEMLYKKVLESCTNILFSHCHWQSLFLKPVCRWQWDCFCEPHSYVWRVFFSSSFSSLVPGWVQEHSTVTLLFYNSELGDKVAGSPCFHGLPSSPGLSCNAASMNTDRSPQHSSGRRRADSKGGQHDRHFPTKISQTSGCPSPMTCSPRGAGFSWAISSVHWPAF